MLWGRTAKCLIFMISLISYDNPRASSIMVTISEKKKDLAVLVKLTQTFIFPKSHSWYLNPGHLVPKCSHYAHTVCVQRHILAPTVLTGNYNKYLTVIKSHYLHTS